MKRRRLYRSRPRREVAHEPMPARTATTAKPTTHQTVRGVDFDDGMSRSPGAVLAWGVLAAVGWWRAVPPWRRSRCRWCRLVSGVR